MADNGMAALRQARIARSFGGRSVLKPHIDQQALQRGKAAGAGGAGGGARGGGFGAGVGGARPQQGASGDPVISGEGFERKPYIGPFEQGLTENGQQQQHDHQLYQQFAGAYADARGKGASDQEAFRSAAQSLPGGVASIGQLLMSHPEAASILQNTGALFDHLNGASQGPTQTQIKGADGKVYNVTQNPDGSLSNPQDVGLPGTPAKPAPPPKFTVLHTDQGDMRMDAQGNVTPIQFGGRTLADVPKGAAAKTPPIAPSDVQGLQPQVTSDLPKTKPDRLTMNALTTAPTVINALTRMQKMSDNMGLVKGPIAAAAGEYFGINGGGAQFKADRDLVQANAPLLMGSGFAAATKNFMEGTATPSNAPSFIKLQAGQMINSLRDRAQGLADETTLSTQGKLPSSLANQLIGVGVVPNGYQNNQTFDAMPPGEAAQWKMRYQPQALTNQDKAGLLLGAKAGQITDPAMLKSVDGMYQQNLKQRAAMQQQQGSSQAALAAQSQPAGLPAGQPNPAVGEVNPAAQPNNGDQQPQPGAPQGAQQQPSQGQQGNVQEDNGGQPQSTPPGQGAATGGVPGVPGQGVLATGGALPNVPAGQPQPGMPGTNGQTPLPPANPLPLVSQNVTPGGQTPTPSTQPTLQPASPQANTAAAAAPSPILPNAGGGGDPNAAPGSQGEADALSLSQALGSGM